MTSASRTTRIILAAAVLALVVVGAAAWFGMSGGTKEFKPEARFTKAADYTSAKDWNVKAENLVPYGVNPLYFPVKPGHRFILERPDHPDGYYRKEVVVLDKLEPFDLPGIGKFEAAVVQEEEFYDGRYMQQSLNWYAFDKTNNNLYAMGEVSWEVDDEGNRVFGGTWRAGEPDGNGLAEPGMLMPGKFKLGDRYIFDGSESESFGGSENIEENVTIKVPAGTFKNCVRVREQNLKKLKDITDKVWCPGVGVVFDTSDGKLIASSVLPETATLLATFGKHHREKPPAFTPPVAKISGKEATEIALQVIPGKANSLVIERKKGRNVYVVEIIAAKNGAEIDVFVDIETGKVVGTD